MDIYRVAVPNERSVMSDAEFIQYLRNHHRLEVVEVPGDGNCLFSSLAMVLLYNADRQMQVREAAARYIREHPIDFQGFADQHMTLDGMIQETLRNHNFSYEFQLIAASENYGHNILVYFPDGTITSYPHDRRHQRNIHLSFHHGIHYNLLVEIVRNLQMQVPNQVVVNGEKWALVSQKASCPDSDINVLKEIPDKTNKVRIAEILNEGQIVVSNEVSTVFENDDDGGIEILIRSMCRSIVELFLAKLILQLIRISWQAEHFSFLQEATELWIRYCKCKIFSICTLLFYYYFK